MEDTGVPPHLRQQLPAGLPDGQLNDRMGIVVTDWAPDRVVGTMPVDGNRQPYGLLHGGASCVLAETLGSLAAALHAGPGRSVLGIEISASHHRAARSGLVTGVCTPLYAGSTMATYQIVVSDEAGRRICTARLSCVIRKTGPQAGTGQSGTGPRSGPA